MTERDGGGAGAIAGRAGQHRVPLRPFMVSGVKKKILNIRPVRSVKLAARSQSNGIQVSNL